MQPPQRDEQTPDERSDSGRGTRAGPSLPWFLQPVADFLIGKYLKMTGAVLLAIGAVLLIGAWQALTTIGRQSLALRPLTARGTAQLERAWWQLDFDPRPLGSDGTNWLDLTTAQLCARFRVETGTGDATAAVACREWPGFRGLWKLTDDAELAPGVPIPWLDPAGAPAIDLRFSQRAYTWLTARKPVRFYLTPDESGRVDRLAPTEAEAVRVAIDDPLRRLAHAWSTPVTPFPVAYDPKQPTHAVPAALVEEASRPDPADLLVPIGAAFGGAVFWTVGIVLLSRDQPRAVAAAIVVVTLGLVPWWSIYVPRLVGRIWEPAGGFVDFFSRELVRTRPPILLREPSFAGYPGDVVIAWSLDRSRWAAVLARLDLSRPERGADTENIQRALIASARERAAALGLDLDGLPGTSQ